MEIKLGVLMNQILPVRLVEDPASLAAVKKSHSVICLFSGLKFNISLLVLSVRLALLPHGICLYITKKFLIYYFPLQCDGV